jgi:PAS domain S-box-containing protein
MDTNQKLACKIIEDSLETGRELQLFDNAIQMATDGIIIGDSNGYITKINEAFLQLYGGFDKGELVGKHVFELLIEGDQEHPAQDSLDSLKFGPDKTYQYLAISKSGLKIPVEVTASFIIDQHDEKIGFVVIVRNIATRNNKEELRKINCKLELITEKLHEVGSISRHDILNKLQIINYLIFIANRKGNYEQATQGISLASQQIKDILLFSRHFERIGSEELQETDVDLALREAINLFPDLKGINAINECKGLIVLADSLLRQIFYNLIDNTLKYGQKTTKFRVSFEKTDLQIRLIFEDDGVGIPVSSKTQLFTRGVGKGTGLGLFLVKKIIESYGWQVEEKSSEDKGAKFIFTLPKRNYHQKKSSF